MCVFHSMISSISVAFIILDLRRLLLYVGGSGAFVCAMFVCVGFHSSTQPTNSYTELISAKFLRKGYANELDIFEHSIDLQC